MHNPRGYVSVIFGREQTNSNYLCHLWFLAGRVILSCFLSRV